MLSSISITNISDIERWVEISAIIWEKDEEFKISSVDWELCSIKTQITDEGITNVIEEFTHNMNEILLKYWNIFSYINIKYIDNFIEYLGEDLYSTNAKIRDQVIAWLNSIANWWELKKFISSINYEADDTKKKIKAKIKEFKKTKLPK